MSVLLNMLAVIGSLAVVVSIPVWRWIRDLNKEADYWYDKYRELDEIRQWDIEQESW